MSISIGTFQATRRSDNKRSRCRTDGRTGFDQLHNKEARVQTEVDVQQGQMQHVEASKRRATERRPRPAKRHWPCDSEPDCCITNNLLQNNIRNMMFTQIKSNDIEFLFVSKWSKTKDWFSNSFSATINAEDLCSYIKSWNNEITIGIITGENFL